MHCVSMTLRQTLVFILFIYCLILTAAGCTTTGSQPTVFGINTENLNIVWPPPPQIPRIQYLGSIATFSDPGVQRSWFSKTLDVFFGKEEPKGTMLKPYGVFADAKRIYATDTGLHLLHIFDLQEKKYLQIKNAKEQKLVSPIGVTVESNGDIYLTDSVLRKVFIFDKEGNYLGEIGSPEIFLRPAGIALDEDRVYIVDTHGHRVLVFSKKERTLLFSFGKNGRMEGDFNYPTNIFIGKDRLLYVTDSMNFRVQIFNRDGKVLSGFGKHGDGSGDFSKPKGIAVDSEGHIYIADAHFDNVQIFDRDGKLLLVFGNTGRRAGEMILPAGIFIDEMDRIYVVDSYNKRIQIFQYLKEQN